MRSVVALFVLHIPAEAFEKGVDELLAQHGFAVARRVVFLGVILEHLDQLANLFGSGHRNSVSKEAQRVARSQRMIGIVCAMNLGFSRTLPNSQVAWRGEEKETGEQEMGT